MRKLILFLFAFCLGIATMSAQTVTGVVTGADDGQPLPGVNIKVKGTERGTITDMDGGYSIEVSGEEDVLIFSFVGYVTKEVTVGGQTTIDFVLEVDSKGLEEVVVVGYGIKKKSQVTGAISSLRDEDLEGSSAFVGKELQGKTSGVTVLPTSGAPGAPINVRIRGTSSNGNAEPLYIVDGVKVGDMSFLDPNDIASIEILKDGASSAIYGAEGGNGVVLITTKKGTSGDAIINYNFQYGIQSPNTLPTLMNPSQYQTYLTENGVDYSSNINSETDWLDEIFQTAPMQKHYLSVSGGSERTSLLASISYMNQDGILGGEKANYERITGRINAEYKAKEWLKVGVNVGYAFSDRAAITEDSRMDGIIGRALLIDPLTPVTHADNDLEHIQENIDNLYPYPQASNGQYYGISKYTTGEIVNPVLSMDILNGSTKRNEINGSAYIEITPIEGLSYISRLGFGYAHQNNHFYSPTYYYSSERNVSSTSVYDNTDSYGRWQWENFVTYTKSFDKHNLAVTAGISMEKRYHRYLNASSGPMNIEGDKFIEHDYTTFVNQVVRGNLFEDKLASYFGRVSYDFGNRYLFEATVRRDGAGTSKLPSGSNWGTFPSVSAGWVLSNEDFWSIDLVNYAKIRGSWGQNGSLSNLPYYSYSDDMSAEGLVYPTPAGKLPVFEPFSNGNPGLTWETSEQFDIGLDLQFSRGRYTLSLDYFNKKTLDLLTLGTPSATAGADSPYFNAGDVENKGFEIDLGIQNRDNELKYSINFNVTTLSNNVSRLDDNISIILGTTLPPSWSGATAFSENQPIWYFRGYKTDGVDPVTGQPNFVDVSGPDGEPDGVINSDDITYIGDPHPDFLYGLSANLEYKGFDFSFVMQGSQGNDVLLGWLRSDRPNINFPAFRFEDRWTPATTNASQPRMDRYNENDNPEGLDDKYYQSDMLVFDGSFLKIRQIQLGYSLPSSLLSSVKISKARVYVSLDDYFTFTKYEGMDPEAGSTNNQSQGIDQGVYPTPRKVMFGLSVTF
jgi:TonB-linked SusC/RagA family outer membrane protein